MIMKKRVVYSVLLAVLGLNLLLGFGLQSRALEGGTKDDPYRYYELFASVLEKVRKEYVDADKVTYEELIQGALKGMIGTLDPHSEFMEARKYDELRDDTQGEFGGVGLQIGLRDNMITVIAPMEDTPAFKAGILSGDQIVRIEGKSTEKYSLSDTVKQLRGKPDSEVTITTLRPSNGESRDVKLTRSHIRVASVRDITGGSAFPVDGDKIGYVRINQFVEPTSVELDKALKKLSDQDMKGLVIDLRSNPGGLLDQAVKVCEKFVPRNQLIVTTEGRTKEMKSEHYARGRNPYRDLPLVILVNGGSASASEIVAGCLQDLKRAFIIGEQTFGKGSVQSILPLPDGSALRLTTAKYYTPAHREIHEKGITPDSIVPMSADEEEALLWKRSPGGPEMAPEDKRERARNARDTQLERALDVLKGLNQTVAQHQRRRTESLQVAQGVRP